MTAQIEAGDLFRDKDRRQLGDRIVRVVEVVESGTWGRHQDEDVYKIVNENHWNEKLIGRTSWVSESGLLRRFEKVSH